MKRLFFTTMLIASGLLGMTTMAKAQSWGLLHTSYSSWAAGQCCARGVDYEFQFQVLFGTQDVGIDSVFIGQEMWLGPENSAPAVQVFPDEFGARYVIHLSNSWSNEMELLDVMPQGNPTTLTAPYEGVAKIVFHIGKQQHEMLVSHFDEVEELDMP